MKKVYITTSIAYANGAPHIGFALESIQADVLARYFRQEGDDVYFLTGTDEHGTKIARAAESANVTPQEFVNDISAKFQNLKDEKVLNLSYNDFIRTTEERHKLAAQKLWSKLVDKGVIYKKSYEGLYCVGCESFKAEKDLIDGKCPDHQKAPELIKEENYFFNLSEYKEKIKEYLSGNQPQGEGAKLQIFPESRRNEILALLNDDINEVSFSRPRKNLSWGISIPDDPEQTMYVWCDALANYISALGYANDGDNFKKYWSEDTEIIHVIGKDILRFHALIWPAMLLAAELPLPKKIFVHGHITVSGQKMSKSLGNVVDPVELAEKYGVDPVRYYLLREIPSGEDGDYSEEKFIERFNGDLANGLGNFAARVSTLAEKLGEITEVDFINELDEVVKREISSLNLIEGHLTSFRLHEAVGAAFGLIKYGDGYLQEVKPWDKTKTEEEKKKGIYNALYILNEASKMIAPFLPETSEKILANIKRENGKIIVTKINNLFPRLEK